MPEELPDDEAAEGILTDAYEAKRIEKRNQGEER